MSDAGHLRESANLLNRYFSEVLDFTRPLDCAVDVRGTRGYSSWAVRSNIRNSNMLLLNVNALTHSLYWTSYSPAVWQAWGAFAKSREDLTLPGAEEMKKATYAPWVRPCLILDLGRMQDRVVAFCRGDPAPDKPRSVSLGSILSEDFKHHAGFDPLATREFIPDTSEPGLFVDLIAGLKIDVTDLQDPLDYFEALLDEVQNDLWAAPKRYMLVLHTGWSQMLPSHPNLGHPVMESLHRYMLNPYLSVQASTFLARRRRLAGVAFDAETIAFPLAALRREYALNYVWDANLAIHQDSCRFGLPEDQAVRRLPFADLVLLRGGKLVIENLLIDRTTSHQLFPSRRTGQPRCAIAIGVLLGQPLNFGREDYHSVGMRIKYQHLAYHVL